MRKMRSIFNLAVGSALTLAVLGSCSNDPTLGGASTTGANLVFHQIATVGNAGTNEFFAPYANHDVNNRTAPSADANTLGADVTTFMTGFAGRSSGIAQYVTSNLLIPDVLLADLSQPNSVPASYLGVQSQGLISFSCTGAAPGKFGGRALTDDVVDATLSIAFGSVVPTVSAALGSPVPDDHNEKNGTGGTPQLVSDNVGCSDKTFNFGAFPYLGNPH